VLNAGQGGVTERDWNRATHSMREGSRFVDRSKYLVLMGDADRQVRRASADQVIIMIGQTNNGGIAAVHMGPAARLLIHHRLAVLSCTLGGEFGLGWEGCSTWASKPKPVKHSILNSLLQAHIIWHWRLLTPPPQLPA